MNLYYRGQMSVDTASHFITHIQAFHGNVADNIGLIEMAPQIVENMQEHYLQVKEVLADTGYSSGDTIRSLLAQGIEAYIPNTGSYKPDRDKEGFTYDPVNDHYTCLNGALLIFRRLQQTHGINSTPQKVYATRAKDCRDCPFKSTCATSAGFKAITDSVDKPLYDQMHLKMESKKGKRMRKLRSSTVEPVFGSLINYTGLNRINAKGLKQANKCMLMAAVAYNLKKLLKCNKVKTAQGDIKQMGNTLNSTLQHVLSFLREQHTKTFLFQF